MRYLRLDAQTHKREMKGGDHREAWHRSRCETNNDSFSPQQFTFWQSAEHLDRSPWSRLLGTLNRSRWASCSRARSEASLTTSTSRALEQANHSERNRGLERVGATDSFALQRCTRLRNRLRQELGIRSPRPPRG